VGGETECLTFMHILHLRVPIGNSKVNTTISDCCMSDSQSLDISKVPTFQRNINKPPIDISNHGNSIRLRLLIDSLNSWSLRCRHSMTDGVYSGLFWLLAIDADG
jgi:hypothetical protein